jgi:hypothetical protein
MAMSQTLATDLARAGLLERPGAGIPQYVDTKNAARILNVSASFLNKARLTGTGPSYAKFGFHVRYPLPALLAWAESRTRQSTSDSAA